MAPVTPLLPREGDLQFRRLLEKLPAGAYTCNPDGLITYFNQRAEELWGRAPKLNDPVDRYCGSFKLYSPEGAPIDHDQCWMALALRMNKEYNEREIVIERPDGRRLTVQAHANPIHDESGKLLGAVNVLVNISDRKRSEEAVREVREFERRRIARNLHDSVLQDLAYVAQIMEVTKLSAEGTGLERELQEEADVIRRVARELRSIVYDLHIGDEENQPFLDLLQYLVERNRAMLRGCEITLEAEGGLLEVPLGKIGTEILHILREALANARCHSGAANIRVSAKTEGGYLVVEVSDDGRGFGQESAPGIGLRSMRERAHLLGARLEVESRSPKGTKVRFIASVAELLQGASGPVQSAEDVARDGSGTILTESN